MGGSKLKSGLMFLHSTNIQETASIRDVLDHHLAQLGDFILGLTYQLGYGIGSNDLSLGRTCWSETFNKIVVAA